MKKYLTIGEAAKLLGTTTFNLRYYEKEGLVKPVHMTEGGYRLYDYDEIYYLSAVKTLRDSNIPIKEIKELMKDQSMEGYIRAMKKSSEEIRKEIQRLEVLQGEVEETLGVMNEFAKDKRKFIVEELPTRRFTVIRKSDYEMNYPIKEIYDIYLKNKIDMSEMYKSDMHYILTDDNITLCLQDDSDRYDLENETFEGGRYLKYTFFSTEAELEARIGEFFQHIIENRLSYDGELLLKVRVKALVTGNMGCGYELQIKIK